MTLDEINEAVSGNFPGSPNLCHSFGPNWAVAHGYPDESSIRPGGFISGPSQFAIADAALWFMTFASLGEIELMALTSELSIRFLRPAVGTDLWAKATIEKAGRRNIVGSVRIWVDGQEDRPTAVAQGTYVLP